MFVGIDVGGTFTDLVLHDPNTMDALKIVKVPTTSLNPETAVVGALLQLTSSPSIISLISHATTIATNALLTHKGLAKTALITNEGFRDVLEIARQRRPEIYNLKTQRPSPLVPRKNRFTIRGRTLANGSIRQPVSKQEIRKLGESLIRDRFQAVAISLLNSYANPTQENATRHSLEKAGFRGKIDISSETDPQYREYERTSTTVVNSSLSRTVSQYLTRLQNRIRKLGFKCPLYVMNSDGTASTIRQASNRPVSIIESGPAAGVLASRYLTDVLGLQNTITFDMGGTTAKAGTINDGRPELAYEFEAAGRSYHGRSVKGSGYPVRQPFIDLAEVSAGGGTIAWLDEIGTLRVGPESAGANPGPAAYATGGRRPTVTDANMILGRLNPLTLLGGNLKLHYVLAVRAIRTISLKLKASIDRTAENIVRTVNDNMSKALRIVTVERGRNPREFALIAFGGAGPLHACELADDLEIKRVIVPPHPGLFSAFGLLAADLSRTFSEPILAPITSNIESYFIRARRHVRKSLTQEGFTNYNTVEQLDLRYQGQAFEITVPYRKDANLVRLFSREHRKLYGYSSNDSIEAVNARVRAIIQTSKAQLVRKEMGPSKLPTAQSTRKVLQSDKLANIPIYNRNRLWSGATGTGPCIIEEYDSTTLVPTRWNWKIDEYENISLLNTS